MMTHPKTRQLITLALQADCVNIAGRRRIVSAALDAQRELNAAVLSWNHPEADATYGEYFAQYLNNVRKDNGRADAWAYKMTRATFPHLPELPAGKRKASR